MPEAAVSGTAREGTHPLAAYLREIERTRFLTRSEEKSLLERIGRGDRAARNEFITAHLKLVIPACLEFRDRGLPLADLIAEGNLGLIRAALHFDGGYGCRFSEYALWWIRRQILRALAAQARFLGPRAGRDGDSN